MNLTGHAESSYQGSRGIHEANPMRRRRAISATYAIGYGKPPRAKQFQKGTSGNPTGRRKKPATLAEALRKELSNSTTVIENGQRKAITKMEAAIARLMDKAILGDMSACRLLLVFAEVMNDNPNFTGVQLEELDQKVLATLFRNAPPEPSS
jgi:hypothetical protein